MRFVLRLVACLLLLLLAVESPYLYRRFWVYPRTEQALAELERKRVARPRADGLLDLRGVLHAHSYLSHDSLGTPREMVRGAQRAGIDFIFMTDHYRRAEDRRVIEKGLRGNYGGVIFLPGVETSAGLIAWFLDGVTLDAGAPLAEQIRQVKAGGGVPFVCHPDEPRPWDRLEDSTGMEIYNLHADAKKSRLTFFWRLSENFWSMSRYPMRVYHTLFHDPGEYLAIWDRLTSQTSAEALAGGNIQAGAFCRDSQRPALGAGSGQRRAVVAIAGNDAHQNNGMRLIVGHGRALVLTDTSPSGRPLFGRWSEFHNWPARRVAGRRRPGETLWRWDADLYERSYHFVNTHLLSAAKDEAALRKALEAGHAYVAFDSLVTATGFDFAYTAPGERAILGDQAKLKPGGVLEAQAPVECLLRLLRNGRQVMEQRGRSLRYTVQQPGVYRVEGHLEVLGERVPWIYANPIYIQ